MAGAMNIVQRYQPALIMSFGWLSSGDMLLLLRVAGFVRQSATSSSCEPAVEMILRLL